VNHSNKFLNNFENIEKQPWKNATRWNSRWYLCGAFHEESIGNWRNGVLYHRIPRVCNNAFACHRLQCSLYYVWYGRFHVLKGCPDFNNFQDFDTKNICVKIVIFFVLLNFFISTTTTFFNLFYFSDLLSLCFSYFFSVIRKQ